MEAGRVSISFDCSESSNPAIDARGAGSVGSDVMSISQGMERDFNRERETST